MTRIEKGNILFADIIQDKINNLKREEEYEVNSKTKEMLEHTIIVLEELLYTYNKRVTEQSDDVQM